MEFQVRETLEGPSRGCDPARLAMMQRRYQEALRLSQWFEKWGGRAREAAPVAAFFMLATMFVFASGCHEAAERMGAGGAFVFGVLLFGAVGAAVAAMTFNFIGLLLAGKGQLLRTSLEIAINTSSLFSDDQRWELLEPLSVLPVEARPWADYHVPPSERSG